MSAVAGYLTWAVFALAVPTREAWDTDAWWYVALPILGILSAVFGYLLPVRVWRWPVAVLAGELAGLWSIPRDDASFTLFSLAVPFVLAPLVIGFVGLAMIGAVFANGQKWGRAILW
ncbi:MAG TPA: hypothetical protein VHA70_15435 [Bauldia sp.]|nr:hypothetical protein [Bauldia sp.]